MAAVHWYNPAKHDFDDFLSWRTDLFKTMLIECAASIHRLDLDRVEAAMLNALIVIATGDDDDDVLSGCDFCACYPQGRS